MVPLLYDDLIQKAAFTWISCPNERSPAAGLCEHIRRKISPTKTRLSEHSLRGAGFVSAPSFGYQQQEKQGYNPSLLSGDARPPTYSAHSHLLSILRQLLPACRIAHRQNTPS